jgi:lipopolysaccharide transport system ATP-binding protein
VVRLYKARVRTESGQTSETVDIRQPVGIEVEFEVLKPGVVLAPNFHFYNQEGICVFIAGDQDPAWRNTPRPTGRYVSTAWIPGNFLAEGTLIVNVAISTMNPVIVHVHERDAVAFQVVDSLVGDSVRGEFAGNIPGLVRPRLKWETHYLENHQNPTLPSP